MNDLSKARYCTCKNRKCRTRFWIDPEGDLFCPVCKTMHCPSCLKSCEGIKTHESTINAGSHWGTNVEGLCPHCRYAVIDYDYQ